jgi:hypothetical protein
VAPDFRHRRSVQRLLPDGLGMGVPVELIPGITGEA